MVIAGFQKSSLIDYPKKISAVVFTQGCNMNCSYCHNRQLINTNSQNSIVSEMDLLEFLQRRKRLLDGVVVTGGEPTLQMDLINFIEQLKKLDLLVKLDTNGTNPIILKKLIDRKLIDYVAMDVKAPLTKYCKVCCAKIDTDKIDQSIDIILEGKIEYEFRTTYAPGLSGEDLIDITRTIKGASQYIVQQYKEVDQKNGMYTGKVTKRNILNVITREMKQYVSMLKFRGEFGII